MTEARAHTKPAWWLWLLVIVVLGGATIGAYVKSRSTARNSRGAGAAA